MAGSGLLQACIDAALVDSAWLKELLDHHPDPPEEHEGGSLDEQWVLQGVLVAAELPPVVSGQQVRSLWKASVLVKEVIGIS